MHGTRPYDEELAAMGMRITETPLPGVGIRYEFPTRVGDIVGVVVHRGGRREVVRYSREDPDQGHVVLALDEGEARTLAELLGGSQVSEHISAMQQVEGLIIDWVKVPPDSPVAGQTLAQAAVHSRTGVTVVAFLDERGTRPAPGADDVMEVGATMVVAGERDGIDRLHALVLGRG